MGEPISLAAARAEKAADGSLWKVEDCLREVLRQIETGEFKAEQCTLHFTQEMPDGGKRHRWWQARMTRMEQIAVLHIAQAELVKDIIE